MTFLEAVAREEGFYVTGSRPNRDNNPGDIEFGAFARAHGSLQGDPRFARFSTVLAGFHAMQALFLTSAYLGHTIEQALNRWAPPVENNTNVYVDHVCEWTGLHPDDLLSADALKMPTLIM